MRAKFLESKNYMCKVIIIAFALYVAALSMHVSLPMGNISYSIKLQHKFVCLNLSWEIEVYTAVDLFADLVVAL